MHSLFASNLVIAVLLTEGFGVIAAAVLLTVGKAIPKQTLFLYGTTAWISFYLLLPTITPSQWYLVYPFSVILGIGVATAQMIPISYVTDLGDYVDLALHRRMEGMLFAIIHFGYKVGIGASILLFTELLNRSGFTPHAIPVHNGDTVNVVMPLSVERAIRWYSTLIPGSLVLIAMVLNKYNKISKEDHARVVQLLSCRVVEGEKSEKIVI